MTCILILILQMQVSERVENSEWFPIWPGIPIAPSLCCFSRICVFASASRKHDNFDEHSSIQSSAELENAGGNTSSTLRSR